MSDFFRKIFLVSNDADDNPYKRLENEPVRKPK